LEKGSVVVPWQQIKQPSYSAMLPNLEPFFSFSIGEVVTSYYNKVCHRFLPSGERYKCAIIFDGFANVSIISIQYSLPTTNPDFQMDAHAIFFTTIENAHFTVLTN